VSDVRAAGCSSLSQGYAVRDIANVLGTTQDLETHVTAATGILLSSPLDVISGGGLKPDGAGVRSAQQRLLSSEQVISPQPTASGPRHLEVTR
jgi:hypothetical protein